jgi:hypothetical protein
MMPVGVGGVMVEGDMVNTTPNTVFEGPGVSMDGCGNFLRVQGIRFIGDDDDQNGVFILGSGNNCLVNQCDFGAFTGTESNHMHVYGPNKLAIFGGYRVSGGAGRHIWAEGGSTVDLESHTLTLSGTPAFSNTFMSANNCSHVVMIDVAFSGSATGKKYEKGGNGALVGNVSGSTITDWNSYLPGNANGDEGPNDAFEGTWYPTLLFNGSSTGITYGTQVGSYRRDGNKVTLWGTIKLSSKGSATGVAQVSGLPWNVVTSTGYETGGTLFDLANITAPAGAFGGPFTYLESGDARIDLKTLEGDGTETWFSNTDFANNSEFAFCIEYRLA